MIVVVFLCFLAFGDFGAVFVVLVAVGGIEDFFEGEVSAAGEAEEVGAGGDDFVAGEEAVFNFDELVVFLAGDDGSLDERVGEIKVLHVDDAIGDVSLNGFTRDGGDVFASGGDDGELGAHSGAQGVLGIFDEEDGIEGA